MSRVMTLLALSLIYGGVSADAALRPDGLVFNQTVPLVAGQAISLPLYLTRRGEYYAEAILERTDDSERPTVVKFALNIQIDRDDKVLFNRAVSESLGRERPIATLFWLTSDREVPIKTPLTFALSVDTVSTPANSNETLRIQIKRKLNPKRFF